MNTNTAEYIKALNNTTAYLIATWIAQADVKDFELKIVQHLPSLAACEITWAKFEEICNDVQPDHEEWIACRKGDLFHEITLVIADMYAEELKKHCPDYDQDLDYSSVYPWACPWIVNTDYTIQTPYDFVQECLPELEKVFAEEKEHRTE